MTQETMTVAAALVVFLLGVLSTLAVVGFGTSRYTMEPTVQLTLDATTKVTFKNAKVQWKDVEGSPVGDPVPVTNLQATITASEGNFGALTTNENGEWVFDPGDEVDKQAMGVIRLDGSVTNPATGETVNVATNYEISLEPGAPVTPEIEVELVPVDAAPPAAPADPPATGDGTGDGSGDTG